MIDTSPSTALALMPELASDWMNQTYFERLAAANALLYTFGLIPDVQYHRIDLRLRELMSGVAKSEDTSVPKAVGA